MRKWVIVLTVLPLVALSLMAVVSTAAPGCTETGTNGRDVMAGTRGRDVLCAKQGDDFAHANGGRDTIRGGRGGDTLTGGKGNDRILGKQGPDRIFAVDGRGGDVIRGGGGRDHCYGDAGDSFRGCHVHIGLNFGLVLALTDALFDTTRVAEQQIEEAGGPPVTVTATVTATVTVTVPPLPACVNAVSVPPPCAVYDASELA
jgi:hypothetical protein